MHKYRFRSAVYLAITITPWPRRHTQAQVCKAAQVTEVTLRNTCREMGAMRDELVGVWELEMTALEQAEAEAAEAAAAAAAVAAAATSAVASSNAAVSGNGYSSISANQHILGPGVSAPWSAGVSVQIGAGSHVSSTLQPSVHQSAHQQSAPPIDDLLCSEEAPIASIPAPAPASTLQNEEPTGTARFVDNLFAEEETLP